MPDTGERQDGRPLSAIGGMVTGEGTIYPLLARLRCQGAWSRPPGGR
ncbi:MAG: hypothetical protein ACHP9Z_07280 [Streptosporangiales bacterium]